MQSNILIIYKGDFLFHLSQQEINNKYKYYNQIKH